MKNINFYAASRSGHHFVSSVIKSWFPDEICKHISHENAIVSNPGYQQYRYGPRILVIRNFLNWAASFHMHVVGVLQKGNKDRYQGTFDNLLRTYREVLEEYKESKYYNADVKVYYDKFKDDEQYRREICEKLGGTYTEVAIEFVPAPGRASSFDADRFQGRASQMQTSTRYKQVEEFKEEFLNILRANKDLIDKWKEVFGATEEEIEFINNL